MEGIQNNDVATLALLNGGFNGGGYGGYGNNNRGDRGYGDRIFMERDHGNFQNDGSVINAKMEAHRDTVALSHDHISQQASDNADRNRDIARTQGLDRSFERQSDKITDQTRFFTSELNTLSREQAANARIAADCCCEQKILAIQNQAKTDAGFASVLANQACTTAIADAVANAIQNTKLDQLLANI